MLAYIIKVPYLDGGYLEIDQRRGFQKDEQLFSHIDRDGNHRHFDIAKLYRMARATSKRIETMDFDSDLVTKIQDSHGIEADHLARITKERAEEPGLILHFDDDSHLILDGGHRLVKRHAMGCTTMDFYVFGEKEARPAMLDIPSSLTPELIRRS